MIGTAAFTTPKAPPATSLCHRHLDKIYTISCTLISNENLFGLSLQKFGSIVPQTCLWGTP